MPRISIHASMQLEPTYRPRSMTNRLLVIAIWVSLIPRILHIETARAEEAAGDTQQQAAIQEVVGVANEYITKNACEASSAEPSVVATMVPYTEQVAAGQATAKFAVLWAGDIGCRGGSGTNTMNILLIEKRGKKPARVVDANPINSAANFERIVTTTADSLTVDVYTWSEDDPQCCASQYERWTLQREVDTRPWMPKGHYVWVVKDSKPAEPVPLAPGEKKLPTASVHH